MSAAPPPVLRCGRRLPVVHLFEAEELFAARYHWRAFYPAVCGAELTEPEREEPDPDSEECPGCRDCVQYCAGCVREVARFAERETAAERSAERSAE